MKKIVASLLFLVCFFVNAQESSDNDFLEIEQDSIVYNKNTDITEQRTFKTDLKDKYSGKDFEYKENAPQKKKKTSNSSSGLFSFLAFFMTSIFPFLLGGFIIFVILKTMLGIDARFWKKTKDSKKLSEKLIYEDEDIHELNLETLLQQAIDNKDFRLAIRYYYLTTLKGLSNKELIDYHKDKTNSEYLFEIENKEMRTNFSYLSYVYSYVWYGEFPVDENSFKVAENKYQSFLKSIV
jgi:hypothetical protein